MALPPPLQTDAVQDPEGARVPLDMSFKLMAQKADTSAAGSVRIADMRNFTISSDIAAALVDARARPHAGNPLAPHPPMNGNTTSRARRG